MAVVAILAGYAPSLINFRGHLIKDLIARQACVYAIAPDMDTETASVLIGYGARPIRCGFDRVGLNAIKDLVNLIRLALVLYKIRCDLFVGYTVKPVVFGTIAAKMSGVRDVYALITGLGYSFFGESKKQKIIGCVARLIYKIALHFCSGVIFQNPDDLIEFKLRSLLSHERVTVVNGSGVDLDRFSPVGIPDTGFRFLMIARLYREKGICEYLRAAEKIKSIYPGVKIRLVGRIDGNPNSIDPNFLIRFIDNEVIEYFEGSKDVREHIKESTVLVHPSYREGVPRVVLEAMAMARPIITTDAPGCRETVQHGVNGFLINIRDSTALVNVMARMIEEPQILESMGRKSREIAEERFNVHSVNCNIIKFLKI